MVALAVVVVAKQVTADRARLAKAIVAAAPQMAAVQPVVVVLVVPVAETNQRLRLEAAVVVRACHLLFQVLLHITLAVVAAHMMAQEVMVAAVMALWELVALGVMAPVIQAVAAGVLIMIQIRVVPVDRVW
jgi:hypothetical protein